MAPRSFAGLVLGLMLVLNASGCASTPDLVSAAQDTTESERHTIAACTDLVLDYALYRDQIDVERFVALFAPQGRLSVQGKTYVGLEAIRARMSLLQNAKAAPKTRHLMSTIRINQVSENRATGISYVTVYAGAAPSQTKEDEDSGELETVNGFAIIGNYIDEFERTPQGWRIASRRLEGAFRDASFQ